VTLSEAWDRMFWSIMITIFVGLVWMGFLQSYVACEGPGLVVAITVGIVFFATGWRTARAKKQQAAGLGKEDA
jgi:hypothetical protein